jgi:hypothetical protein
LVSLNQVASLYTSGLAFFHERLVPHLKRVRGELSGGVWDLADFVAYAADSDVDFMTHLVEAVWGRSAFGLRRVLIAIRRRFAFQSKTAVNARDLDVTLVCVEL